MTNLDKNVTLIVFFQFWYFKILQISTVLFFKIFKFLVRTNQIFLLNFILSFKDILPSGNTFTSCIRIFLIFSARTIFIVVVKPIQNDLAFFFFALWSLLQLISLEVLPSTFLFTRKGGNQRCVRILSS